MHPIILYSKGRLDEMKLSIHPSRDQSMAQRRQSCCNLSHSKEVVARRDWPQVVRSSVVFFFQFFLVGNHSGDLP